MIEVEKRALLTPEQRASMLAFMSGLGRVHETSRVMIDFSGQNRTQTIVLRINNGVQELVTKTGSLTDTVRQESKATIPAGVPLHESLSHLAAQGHTSGMLSLRRMYSVKTKDFEYSVRDVLNCQTVERAAVLFDLEAVNVQAGSEAAAEAAVIAEMSRLGLVPLTPQQWTDWVTEMYSHVDEPFTYAPQAARTVEEALRSRGMI